MDGRNEIKRLTLREVIEHSGLCKEFHVGNVKLQIKPWSTVELEELAPLVADILTEVKKKKGDEDVFNAFIAILSESKRFIAHARKIVYVTLKHGNEKIHFETDGKTEEYDFFTEEEINQELPLNTVFELCKLIWKQNFEKNLSTSSKEKTKMMMENKETESL